jgi:hypothetical protein
MHRFSSERTIGITSVHLVRKNACVTYKFLERRAHAVQKLCRFARYSSLLTGVVHKFGTNDRVQPLPWVPVPEGIVINVCSLRGNNEWLFYARSSGLARRLNTSNIRRRASPRPRVFNRLRQTEFESPPGWGARLPFIDNIRRPRPKSSKSFDPRFESYLGVWGVRPEAVRLNTRWMAELMRKA